MLPGCPEQVFGQPRQLIDADDVDGLNKPPRGTWRSGQPLSIQEGGLVDHWPFDSQVNLGDPISE